MESLLSLSFDYLSSFDGVKIKKGLRQLEGLLAQICLSKSTQSSAIDRRRSMISTGTSTQPPKELASLKDDPAFREFFKLQEGFEWNGMRSSGGEGHFHFRTKDTIVAIRLISCLERLLGKGSSTSSSGLYGISNGSNLS